MKPKIKYRDEPLGVIKPVRDFLPPPEKLVFRENLFKPVLKLGKKPPRKPSPL